MEKTGFEKPQSSWGEEEGIRAVKFRVKPSYHQRVGETTWHGDNGLGGSDNVSLFPTVSSEPLVVLG